MPKELVESNEAMKRGRDLQKDVPIVTMKDFEEAGAFAFGTPTRYGNMAAQLKEQFDELGPLWMKGTFEGKPAGAFVSTGTLHGGQETTLHTLMAVLIHLGMVIVGVPYSTKALFVTKGGGSPYGPGHIAGPDNAREIDAEEAAICRVLGKRLAELGLKLQK